MLSLRFSVFVQAEQLVVFVFLGIEGIVPGSGAKALYDFLSQFGQVKKVQIKDEFALVKMVSRHDTQRSPTLCLFFFVSGLDAV